MRNNAALSSGSTGDGLVKIHDEAKFERELTKYLQAIGPNEAISRFLSHYAGVRTKRF